MYARVVNGTIVEQPQDLPESYVWEAEEDGETVLRSVSGFDQLDPAELAAIGWRVVDEEVLEVWDPQPDEVSYDPATDGVALRRFTLRPHPTVTANRATIPADGSSTATVTFADTAQDPVDEIVWDVNGDTVTSAVSATGEAIVAVTAAEAGPITVAATFEGRTVSTTVTAE